MPTDKARVQFEQGLSHFHKEDYDKALTFFEEAILEDPSYSEALYNLACCCSMTDQPDKTFIYLSRAVNLNPHCIDWAKDDREFNSVRNNDIFQKIISGQKMNVNEAETPLDDAEAAVQEPMPEEMIPEIAEIPTERPEAILPSEPLPNLDDGSASPLPSVEEEGLPPCNRCEGVVKSERRPRTNTKLALLIVFAGIGATIVLFVSYLGFIGIPIISFGLYCLSQIDDIWVCQNCGAMGEDCGQPPRKSKNANAS